MADAPDGVLFAPEDHAGLLRRVFIGAVDATVLLLLAALLLFLHETCGGQGWAGGQVLFWTWIALAWLYRVPLEAASGTLGFRLAGVRIVTWKGTRPSWTRLTFRLLLILPFGYVTPLLDFLFLAGEPFRQSFRDKLTGVLVVRKERTPAPGRMRLKRLTMMGSFSFCAWEAEPTVAG